MSDARRVFILRIASHLVGLNLNEEKLPNVDALKRFCDSDEQNLIITRLDARGHVEVSNDVSSKPAEYIQRVVFYKPQPSPLSADNYRREFDVLAANHPNNPEALVSAVKQVIGSEISLGDGVKNADYASKSNLREQLKSLDKRYEDIVEPLTEKLLELHQGPIDEAAEFVGTAEYVLDSLWNSEHGFDQDKMRSLIDAVAHELCLCVERQLGGGGGDSAFWRRAAGAEQLETAVAACDQWLLAARLFTEHAWRASWPAPGWRADRLLAYRARLCAVLAARRLADQLGQLRAPGQAAAQERVVQQLERAAGPNLFSADPALGAPPLRALEDVADAAVQDVLPTMKSHLNSLASGGHVNPIPIICKYREILSRPGVKSKVVSIREGLFTQITEFFRKKRNEFLDAKGNNRSFATSKYLTDIGAKVVWVRSNILQFEQIERISNSLFNDLAAFNHFDKELKLFMAEIKQFEADQFSMWCKDILDEIDDPKNSIALETAGRLMKMDREKGLLTVSYSDRLFGLLREVGQLSSLGFSVPRKVQQCTRVAEQFYKYGNVLKQVAHFYNTIEQQMLPCQQAMMIDEALRLDRLVVPKDSAADNNVTWENPQKLKDYIEELQKAAVALTTHNRQLRKSHAEICTKVMKLLDVDFLKDINLWNGVIAEIRQKFAEEERRVSNPANMRPWAIFWDKQLYKVVQVQFAYGLNNVHSLVGPIQVQVALRDHTLTLRPSLPETKAKLYAELQKFFIKPSQFSCIQRFSGTEQSPFSAIPLLNIEKFDAIYASIENHFTELAKVCAEFEDWMWLSRLDVEELVAQTFTKAHHWEKQLSVLKAKQKLADEIQVERTVGPFVVSMMNLKNTLNTMLRRMTDTLYWTLKNAINVRMQAVGAKVKRGTELLATKPQTMQEVSDISKNYIALKKDIPEIMETMSLMDEQNALLRRLTGLGIADLTEVDNEVVKYRSMLEMFDDVIKEQVEAMKGNVSERAKQLSKDAELLFAHWSQFKPTNNVLEQDSDVLVKNVGFIRQCQEKCNTLKEQYDLLKEDCNQFDISVPDIAIIEKMESELEDASNNYAIFEEFDSKLKTMGETEWILFRNRAYLFDEFLQEWSGRLERAPVNPIVVRLRQQLAQLADFAAALKYCRGESLGAQHWAELFRALGLPRGLLLEQCTLNHLLGVRAAVVRQVPFLKELNGRAQGEAAIRLALQELELWTAQAALALADYRHANGQTLRVVRDWKEPIYQVKDNQTLLLSLKSSPYYAQFRDQTAVWERRVADLDQHLHQLSHIQRRWVYLEPIFGRGALPAERPRFQRADAAFRSILHDVARDPRLLHLADQPSLGRSLEEISEQLSRCQRALNDFLEVKRVAFPRFYFLGDDDLLEILGQSTNPSVIQNHLKKLFQGIEKVIFDQEKKTIRAVVSPEGEQVTLLRPVTIVADVEVYLTALVEEIKATLKKLLFDCLAESTLDPSRYPAQLVCLAEQVRFTRDVEQLLEKKADLAGFKKQLQAQLDQFTQVKVEDALMETKLKHLILDVIHHIRIVEQLTEDKNRSASSWAWQKQIRFYARAQDVVIKHVDVEFQYTYEYQGCAPKLVHTPLTDKCYLTLTHALSAGLGGNPFGPAGTGKTESVKALGNLFGRQVLVFNCDEGIDVHAIGRMFIGLIQCGAWGCFDEFNRLDKDVLSTVSGQVQILQDAIKTKAASCELNQRRVNVDHNAAIFITLNPAGKGYGGRRRLPDNLQQLFRPVVMSRPNNAQIAETLLFAEGFKRAPLLARKIVTAFAMSRDLLSAQLHYDWGLRSMKTVLKGCGSALALARRAGAVNEEGIVLQTLMLSTLSKLTFADVERFNALLKDVFPETKAEVGQFADLLHHVSSGASEEHIELTRDQLTKVLELQEQLSRRTGVVIVGPPGSGKTTLWRLLRHGLEKLDTHVSLYTMNPKAMPKSKFIGELNLDTREWTDGVLTAIAREVAKDSQKPSWIVCDGDVDPDWIEALNSVLDDNKLLTMPTGERIQFGDNVNFIFETDDLTHASPATISRMGMIYISDETVEPSAHIKRLCALKECKPEVEQWLNDAISGALNWVKKHKDTENQISRVAIIENVFSLTYTATCSDEFKVGLLRGLMPYVSMDAFAALSQELVFSSQPLPDPSNPCNLFYDDKSMSLQAFSDDSTATVELSDLRYEEKRPTILTSRMKVARDTVAKWLVEGNRQSFCVLGPDGSGKDQLLRGSFADHYKSALVRLNCGARTSAKDVIDLLTRHCVQVHSAAGRTLKPKDKDYLIVYLKSIDLIQQDKYDSSMTLNFLEDMLRHRGFYDPNNDWTRLENVQLVCTFAHPPSTGRSGIPARFVRSMRTMFMDPPVEGELVVICSAYLKPIIGDHIGSSSKIEAFAASLVEVYKRVKDQFASAVQTHYDYSTRDLVNWILSLLRYSVTSDNIASLLPQISAFEARRIFADRLISAEHRAQCEEIIGETFRANKSTIYAPLPGAFQWSQSIMGKPMEEVQREQYVKFEVCNFPYALSDELIELCIAFDRTLTLAGGHAFIASGADRLNRALPALVAHMHNIKTFSPRVSSAYQLKHLCLDLKQAMAYAALEAEPALFLVEDYQLLEDTFLQYVNQLLSTGHVPGLFTPQELEQMSGQLRELAAADGFDGELSAYFANKVKRQMHIVVALDVEHPDFAQRLQSNPSLYKFCAVIWRVEPDADALKQLVTLSVGQAQRDSELPGLLHELYARAPAAVRKPPKFRALLRNFVAISKRKSDAIEERVGRLRAGVAKLNETRDQVAVMRKEAGKKSKLLAQKQEAADRALAQITQSMTGAKEQRADMEQLKDTTEKESQRIEEQKKLIEVQLKDVEPMLQEARHAVGSIKSESLSEIRSLRAPPEAIRDILQAVLLFMGILDNSWESMRRFLAKNGVKDEIINFDARRVTPEIMKRVQKLLKEKRNSFEEKTAKRASVAAAPLAEWVLANLQYAAILEKIKPLEQEKNTLLKKYQQTEKQMKNLSGQLSTVDQRVEQLRQEFEKSIKEATQVKIDLDREQAAIQVADTMVERLSGEFHRWQAQMETLEKDLQTLDVHCALGAAYTTFLGVEPFDQRTAVTAAWLRAARLPAFDAVAFLTAETEQQRWKTLGLAPTRMAAENAALLFSAAETPLVVDASGQFAAFLQRLHAAEPGGGVQRLQPTQPDFLTQLELAVRFGKVLLVEDVYAFEPALVNLLRRDFLSQGARQVCQIGEKQVDVDAHFRLFLCTRSEQLRIPGFVRNAVVTANFSTTLAGLSSQILSLALNTERPELEEQSLKLATDAENMNIQLAEIEQVLLSQLASSEGSLLENTQLLNSLNKSKENAEFAKESLANLEKVREEIDQQKRVYLPFSEKCSRLYFSFNDLYHTNHMYNFGVSVILDLFQKSFKKHQNASSNINAKLDLIYGDLVHSVFFYVTRALYKQDRLAFALRFVKIVNEKMFDEKEWDYFTGNTVDESAHAEPASVPSWIPEQSRAPVLKLRSCLPHLYSQLSLGERSAWQSGLPPHVEQRLSPLQRLLVLQALAPQVLHSAMTSFAGRLLNLPSLNPPAADLADLAQQVRPEQPILLLLGTGADPSQEIQDLAHRLFPSQPDALRHLAMGSRVQNEALALLRECVHSGQWLYLTNLHLVPEFMLQIHGELHKKPPHQAFRLWLSAEPDEQFPAVPLQDAAKVAYETPPGVKHNVRATLARWRGAEPAQGRRPPPPWRALFQLAWLHALLQERRSFVPQGWLHAYAFNANDLRLARRLVETHAAAWLRGFMEDAVYGGRVESPLDAGVLGAYLRRFLDEAALTGPPVRLDKDLSAPPGLTSIDDYIDFVDKKTPDTDTPSIFGLPENLAATWEAEQSRRTVATLRSMRQSQRRLASFTAFSEWNARLQPVLAFWKHLNQSGDLLRTEPADFAGGQDPLLGMLGTELHFAVSLAKKVHNTLILIRKGLTGKQPPSARTIQAAKSLAEQTTPAEWDAVWSGPEDSADYMELLCSKARSVKALAAAKSVDKLLASPTDLDHFFRPTALLNALRQFSARSLSMAVDELQFVTSLSPIKSSAPCMQLHQLKIQGASLGGQLMPVDRSSPPIASAPDIYIAWIRNSDAPPYRPSECAQVPLFVASDRAEFVTHIQLPFSGGTPDEWTLAGVALFTRV